MSEKTNAPKKKIEAAPAPGGRGRGPASMSQIAGSMGSLKRVVKMYLKQFPVLTWVVAFCIIYNSIAAAIPSIFLQKVIDVINRTIDSGDWASAKIEIASLLIPLIIIYAGAAILGWTAAELMTADKGLGMYLIDYAFEAIKEAGENPEAVAIRGGTDGARLSFLGLPCPNLGTAGYNFHGPMEHITAEGMDTVVKVLHGITKLVAAE